MSSPTQSPLPAERAWRGVETGTPDARRCAELARDAYADPRAVRVLILTDHLDEAAARIEDLRDRATVARLSAELALRTGALAEAERSALLAFELTGGSRRLLSATLIARGAYDAARALGDTAELQLALTHYHRATVLAREDGWWRVATGQPNPARSGWRATLAVALARCGRTDEAITVAEDGLERARAFGAPTALAVALLARALAEPGLEPRAEYAAAAVEVPTPALLVQAEARITFGVTLLRLDRGDEAREPVRRALELALATGAEPLVARSRRMLALTDMPVAV